MNSKKYNESLAEKITWKNISEDNFLMKYDKQFPIGEEFDLSKIAQASGKGKYTNTLNNIINQYQIEQKHIAKSLKVDTATISKHRNGKGPIGWDMAQLYAKYFIVHHAIMVDAFSLLTGKMYPTDTIYVNQLSPGKINVLGEYNHAQREVKMFDQTVAPMYITSTMYNHHIFKNAEEWGLSCLIYVDGVDTKPFENLETFYAEDYHYWLFLNSPIAQKNVNKTALQNHCLCKLKDSDQVLTGMLYEKPRRNQQAPITYQLVHPYWFVNKEFLPSDLNLDGIELEWATPILSIILNPSASGVLLKKSHLVSEEEY